jgi:hypothetical protein
MGGTSGASLDGASVGAPAVEGVEARCSDGGRGVVGATGITHRRLAKSDAGVGIVTSAASGTMK